MQPCPILIINLPSSTDRHDAMAARLARLGLDAEFIEAVDGRAMDPRQRDSHCAESYAAFHSPLTAGEIGCYLSHLQALQHIADQGWPSAVVLEDDVALPEDFAERLSVVCQEADVTIDLIKLSGHLRRCLVLQVLSSGDCLVRYRRPPINANAHLWSSAGARKMLTHSRLIRRPIDVEIKHWWEMNLRIATLSPELVSLDPTFCQASTIGTRSFRTFDGYYRKLRYNVMYSMTSKYRTCRDCGLVKGLRLFWPF
jgi:glycosyl transferase family 25